MKSTGEAIGYDRTMTRALYKALQASGMKLQNYGTVLATIADRDKEEALPLIRRFYRLGFNIEATAGTATFLKENGIRTRVLGKISDGSDEIPDALRQGHVAYVINTRDPGSERPATARRSAGCAAENNVTHVYRIGHRPGSAGCAGRNHADHLHDRCLTCNPIPGRSDHETEHFHNPIQHPPDGLRLQNGAFRRHLRHYRPGAVCQHSNRPGYYLRRPISVCDYDAGYALTIVYKVVGKGTEILSRMRSRGEAGHPDRPWQRLRPAPPPGTAPSYWAAAWASRRCTALQNGCLPMGKQVTVILGFNTAIGSVL